MPPLFPPSILSAFAIALTLFTLTANALYTWTEPDGRKHISTTPARCITPERTVRGECLPGTPSSSTQDTPSSAPMYNWINPQTGTPYLSGKPPSWYRAPQEGPRVLVSENGRITDDTGQQVSAETAKGLKDMASRQEEARQRREKMRRAQRKQERFERQEALDRQGRSRRFDKVVKQAKKSGTAWVVAPGYVVTNHHMISGSQDIWLFLPDGRELKAKPAAVDRVNDLAVLSVDSPEHLPPGIPVTIEPVGLGTEISTIGYPIIPVLGIKPKMTNGIVSSTAGPKDEAGIYQISVPIQKGNSGGPLLNMNGEVIAVTTFKLDAAAIFTWTKDLPENVNYATKTTHLVPLIASLPMPASPVTELSREPGTLAELATRIQYSVLIILVS